MAKDVMFMYFLMVVMPENKSLQRPLMQY
jgi:hypothetical protein